jgi:hypothetical protein
MTNQHSRLLAFIFYTTSFPHTQHYQPFLAGSLARPSPIKSGSSLLRTPDFRYLTSFDAAEVVVTVSSRSEAGYGQFRRPLRLSKLLDSAPPISYWHRQY